MKLASLLSSPLAVCFSVSSLVALSGCADATASVMLSIEFSTVDLDEKIPAFEDAACATGFSESCAVLSAIAGVPYVRNYGPVTEDGAAPRLPLRFAPTVNVQSLSRDVDVGDWFDQFQHKLLKAEGEAAVQRTPLAGLLPETIGAELIADAAIESASLIRSDNTSMRLPAFDIVVGISDAIAADQGPLTSDVDDQEEGEGVDSEDVIIEGPAEDVAVDVDIDEGDDDAVDDGADAEAWLVSRSGEFGDDDGVAALEFGNGALQKLSRALQHPGGYVQVGGTDGRLPQLTSSPESPSTLVRPSGTMSVRLELTLRVPVSALQQGTAPTPAAL